MRHPRRIEVAGVECWSRTFVNCSACGQRVQIGAPSEDCCPALYDKPAPRWVRDFHAEHGFWPVRFDAQMGGRKLTLHQGT